MSDLSELKPWFRDDLLRILQTIYFTARAANPDSGDLKGMVIGLSAVALMVGIDPLSIFKSSDEIARVEER